MKMKTTGKYNRSLESNLSSTTATSYTSPKHKTFFFKKDPPEEHFIKHLFMAALEFVYPNLKRVGAPKDSYINEFTA